MRGRHDPQATMLAFVDLEERVPQDHTIRTIKIIAAYTVAVFGGASFRCQLYQDLGPVIDML